MRQLKCNLRQHRLLNTPELSSSIRQRLRLTHLICKSPMAWMTSWTTTPPSNRWISRLHSNNNISESMIRSNSTRTSSRCWLIMEMEWIKKLIRRNSSEAILMLIFVWLETTQRKNINKSSIILTKKHIIVFIIKINYELKIGFTLVI